MKITPIGMFTALGILALCGCAATTTPATDARLGEALNLMKAQQTINPNASQNPDPVAGVDGKAAKGALDNYRDSFRKPPTEPPSIFAIGSGR